MRATKNPKSKSTLNERGASMLEYAMMASLIAMACIVGVASVGDRTEDTFMEIQEAMDESMNMDS